MAVVEFARDVLGLSDANSSEFDDKTADKVIDLMGSQRNIADKGGTMRLGQWVCCLAPGSKAEAAYGKSIIFERHRHRYEFNNDYRKAMQAAGMVLSGQSADGSLVEIVELHDHPWFVGTQFHPEFKSRPTRPHPLFREFVAASVRHAGLETPPAAPAEASSHQVDARAINGHKTEAHTDTLSDLVTRQS